MSLCPKYPRVSLAEKAQLGVVRETEGATEETELFLGIAMLVGGLVLGNTALNLELILGHTLEIPIIQVPQDRVTKVTGLFQE